MHNKTSPTDHDDAIQQPDSKRIVSTLLRRSFATLATTSPAGVPHVAGVLYEIGGADLWISTLSSSRKARNVATNGRAAICVPIRRLPVGPPSSVQFQARAEVIDVTDDQVAEVIAAGDLRSITSHGELELPDGCFIKVALPNRLHTYGLGMSLRSLMSDPLSAGGSVDVEGWS